MKKKWNVLKKYQDGTDVVSFLLENRGITSNAQIDEFLNPKPLAVYLSEMPLDFKKSVKEAKELILKYVQDAKPILIYGDYDTDGVCATAILYKTLVEVLNHSKCMYF